ncbi:dGTPase [Helicobacter pylori]|uniref:dGTPase n=1 Tax=Helicobacter pylori TaxID=210 RepID=UPI0039C5ADDF
MEKSIKDLQKIFENTDGADERLRKFNQKALEEFKNLESESLKELESLKNNGEWEKFTIAFYGETGVGKSTLIECLRLFFKELGKMDQQECFKRLYANMKNHESSEHAELKELQDGVIIGDGRSDFALETKSYTLKHNNQNFVLLDVPGIEGDEKKVIQQISNATRKAHAIFYVTKTPAPPQKGEEGKEGTIEKIQNQLDSQTEVYTLFNKPINNPRALKDGLIDANEKESLRDLDEKMKAILGKHYMGYTAVSTQAAFYGLSSVLLPETDFYKNKQKFLEFFKAEELLLKSQFKQLGKFIAGTLLENSRKKIIESNCNKALRVIEKLQKAITTTIDREINPTIKELEDAQPETYDKLDYSRDKFVSNLNNSVSKETAIQI